MLATAPSVSEFSTLIEATKSARCMRILTINAVTASRSLFQYDSLGHWGTATTKGSDNMPEARESFADYPFSCFRITNISSNDNYMAAVGSISFAAFTSACSRRPLMTTFPPRFTNSIATAFPSQAYESAKRNDDNDHETMSWIQTTRRGTYA